MIPPDAPIWTVIGLIGAGTFVIRFSFLGLIGRRQMPGWALRLLRYTPVAVIPGLVAPMVFLPVAGETTPDPITLAATAATLAVGLWRKNAIAAMIAGAVVFIGLTWLTH